MRRYTWAVLAAGLSIIAGVMARADEKADLAVKQKEKAKANWKRVFGDDGIVQEETPNLLILAAVSFKEDKLRDLGSNFESELELVRKALHIESKDDPWEGKIAVYLMDDRSKFNSFLRVIAKVRPEHDELGVYAIRGNFPYIAAGPPVEKYDPSVDMQAGMQLAAGILNKAFNSGVPDWAVEGFGRATVWRATPAAYARERAQARALVIRKGRTAKDVWGGNLKAGEAVLLRASLADFLAYGPLSDQFPKFLEGFLPEAGTTTKVSADDALKTINITPDALSQAWQRWAVASR